MCYGKQSWCNWLHIRTHRYRPHTHAKKQDADSEGDGLNPFVALMSSENNHIFLKKLND